MQVSKLIEQLEGLPSNLEVEIATSHRKDEWYEVYDIELSTNVTDNAVVVINTD